MLKSLNKYLQIGIKSYLNYLSKCVKKSKQIPPERVRALIKTYKKISQTVWVFESTTTSRNYQNITWNLRRRMSKRASPWMKKYFQECSKPYLKPSVKDIEKGQLLNEEILPRMFKILPKTFDEGYWKGQAFEWRNTSKNVQILT